MQDRSEVFYVTKNVSNGIKISNQFDFSTSLMLCKQPLTLLCCCRFVYTLNVPTILPLLDRSIYDGMNKDIKEEHIRS